MKGTLYSSDFVKDRNGQLRLLEVNTDTAFASASLDHFDWSDFKNVLSSSGMTSLHVVYKDFQEDLVTSLSESIALDSTITTFETTEETLSTIYPSDIDDSDTKFVLRMAYNEAAIFDSEYCKDNVNTFKLFTEASQSNFVVQHKVSSSAAEYDFDNLEIDFNSPSVPDIAIKQPQHSNSITLDFYKIGHSNSGSYERFQNVISSSYEDGQVMMNYYDNTGDDGYVHAYRLCTIIYNLDLQVIHVGGYKGTAMLSAPDSLSYDDSVILNKVENKHRYEFATNMFKYDGKSQGGVHEDANLISTSSISVPAKDAEVGGVYESIHVSGLPSVDNLDVIFSWSFDGSTLPEGTHTTSSALVSIDSSSLEYGVLNEISMSNDSSVKIGPSLPILAYDMDNDKIEYQRAHELIGTRYQLFDSTGSLVDIVENNVVVYDSEVMMYDLNFEDEDNFIIDNTGVLMIAHNIRYAPTGLTPCFIAGTEIRLSEVDSDGNVSKPIEDIKIGDKLRCYAPGKGTNNGEVGDYVVGEVTNIIHNYTVEDAKEACAILGDGVGVYTINDLGIKFTPAHPFLTKRGWAALVPDKTQEPWLTEQKESYTLEVGDSILHNGVWTEIYAITHVPMSGDTPVYNLTVDGIGTYIADNIVVHNKF